MNFIQMITNDPIALYSLVGLAVVLGICSFYIYYFIKNIHENN